MQQGRKSGEVAAQGEKQSASVRKHRRCQVKRQKPGEEVRQNEGERVKQADSRLKERKIEQCVLRPQKQGAARQCEQRWTGGEEAGDLQQKSVPQDQ